LIVVYKGIVGVLRIGLYEPVNGMMLMIKKMFVDKD
jgi:hypothetical protein